MILITSYRSDCWDSGNRMTQFHEYVWQCEECGERITAYENEEPDCDCMERLCECEEEQIEEEAVCL